MRMFLILLLHLVLTLFFAQVNGLASEPAKGIPLWTGTARGDKGDIGAEADMTKATDRDVGGKPVIRLGNVSKPTISIYKPVASKDTGVAVLVCPGGAYRILAIDLE